jgi:Ca2+-transporting ATPase
MLIALLELIIDPACSVVLEAEPEERGLMRRPPRHPRSHLLSMPLISWAMVQGAISLGALVVTLVVAQRRGMVPEEIRALGFVMLVGLNLALIFVNRTLSASLVSAFVRANRALSVGLGIVAVVLALIFGWPGARAFFGLGPLHPDDLVLCAAGVVAALLMLQLARLGWRRRLES